MTAIKLKKINPKKTKSKLGRKPAPDPKVQVHFWIQTSHVEKVGGMEEARTFCISAMENAKSKTKK